MDNQQIAEAVLKLKNKQDILDLLNHIKKDEMEELGMSDKFHPFTEKHINCYCNPNNTFHRYSQFKIPKKAGGFRQITAPKNESYKLILKYLNIVLRSVYTPSDYAMGFAEHRSVVTNADKHKGRNYVFNIDLKDFFPSIEQPRVWKRLQLPPFNFPIPIANVIAGLCSMKTKNEEGNAKYVLPQGAPTSPIITNMICDRLDHRLAGLAKRFNLNYTRYADDITFSSMHNVYQKNGEFQKELKRIIEGQGFTMNDKKTRLQKKGARQEVTGIIVSDKLNVTQKYVRDIRNILYIWDRYGYNTAYSKFYPKYKIEKGHVKKGNPDLINVVDGKLMYLKMVKGEEDSVYQRLFGKFNILATKVRESMHISSHGVTYIDSTPLVNFEKSIKSELKIIERKKKEKSETTDNLLRHTAYFVLNKEKVAVSIHRSLNLPKGLNKKELLISYCRDAKNETFWLLHQDTSNRPTQNKTINIDELNKELDSLLNI